MTTPAAPVAPPIAAPSAPSSSPAQALETLPLREARGPLPHDGWPVLTVGVGVLLVAVGLVVRRRRRPAVPSPPAATTPAAAIDLAKRLERLRASYRGGELSAIRFIEDLDALARDALAAQAGRQGHTLTSAEWSAQPGVAQALASDGRDVLPGFLALADHVKFGAHVPVASEIEAAAAAVGMLLDQRSDGSGR